MQTLSKVATKILNTLVSDMEPGTVRRIGEKGGMFMQVIVERMTETSFSVAHYYEQNGDLCPDPEMSFHRFETGAWAPIQITQLLGGSRPALQFGDDGKISGFFPGALRDMCSFSTTWFRNIKSQQDLNDLPAAA